MWTLFKVIFFLFVSFIRQEIFLTALVQIKQPLKYKHCWKNKDLILRQLDIWCIKAIWHLMLLCVCTSLLGVCVCVCVCGCVCVWEYQGFWACEFGGHGSHCVFLIWVGYPRIFFERVCSLFHLFCLLKSIFQCWSSLAYSVARSGWPSPLLSQSNNPIQVWGPGSKQAGTLHV